MKYKLIVDFLIDEYSNETQPERVFLTLFQNIVEEAREFNHDIDYKQLSNWALSMEELDNTIKSDEADIEEAENA